MGFMNYLVPAALVWLVFRVAQDAAAPKTERAPAFQDLNRIGGAFIKAMIVACVAAVGIQGFTPDVTGGGWITRFAVVMMLPALIFVCGPFILLSAVVVSKLRVRRGFADVAVGFFAGMLGTFNDALAGRSGFAEILGFRAEGFSSAEFMIAISFPLAGALGGYTFWRSMGCPGVSGSIARKVKTGAALLDVVKGAGDGSAIGVGKAYRDLTQEDEKPVTRRTVRHAPRKGFGRRGA